jgi:hypothetical protein
MGPLVVGPLMLVARPGSSLALVVVVAGEFTLGPQAMIVTITLVAR